MKFAVDNLSCGHCVATVTRTLQSLDPHAGVKVDLAAKTVEVTGALSPSQVMDALAAEDYPARPLDSTD